MRLALNSLFTEDPAKDPALFKVLQSMGLDGEKAILHRGHPAVVGSEERPPLCPPDTATNGLLHESSEPVKVQFTFMLGKFFFRIHCFFGIYTQISLLCVLTEHLHWMDPTQFPSHRLDKAPFFEKHAGMPRFNALFAWLWFHGFCKTVNMVQHLSPASGETFDVLFERKLPKADGSPSEMYVINRNVMALFHFYVVCAPDAGAAYRRAKRTKFHEFVALYKAWEAKGIDWRGELRDLLKLWAPEFQRLFNKKRVRSDKDLVEYEAMQVDPLDL